MHEHLSLTEKFRDLVQAVLSDLGASRVDGSMRETMLIRNGTYCGHRYRWGDFEAVWFIEEDELKFSSTANGTVRRMVASQAIAAHNAVQHQQQKAA